MIIWRDVLHEGPVPAGLSLTDLSEVRAKFLAAQGLGTLEKIRRDLRDRDNCLRRFADYDEVVLWFEWDLYDQLQLLQILDFLSRHTDESLGETGTSLSLVCIEGYLGTLPDDRFPPMFAERTPITRQMLDAGSLGWAAFRSADPLGLQQVVDGGTDVLPFLAGALARHLEEFPSTGNGLSRSERQILEAVAQRPASFSDVFRSTSAREERIYCGDAIMAGYIERMSRHNFPLLAHPTGEPIDAPHTETDSRAFRNAEIALTPTGREVLRGDKNWIELGGSDRWLGGVHLEGERAHWRWDADSRRIVGHGASA